MTADPTGDALGLGPPDPEPGQPEPLTRFDLGPMMRNGGGKEPRRFANGMCYPGRLHAITGAPESCKTLICWWVALTVIALRRNVLVVDEEAGASMTADMLASFGADPDLLDKHLHYLPFPGLTYGPADLGRLGDVLRAHKPVLSVFDSQAAMLAYAHVNENDPGDVSRFWKRVLLPVARDFGSAVLVTDHDAKDGAGSRYGRGTTAKLAEVEVAYKVTAVKPLTRAQDGIITFAVVKDRPGWLHRDWQIRITRGPLALHWDKAMPTTGDGGLSPAAKKLLDVLDDQPLTIPALVDRIAARYGHGLRHDTCRKELAVLLDQGLADKIDQGTGRPALWLKRGNQLADTLPPDPGGNPGGNPDPGSPPPPPDPGWPEGSIGAEVNQ